MKHIFKNDWYSRMETHKIILILSVLLLLILFIVQEKEHVSYYIRSAILQDPIASIPTPSSVLNRVKSFISNLPDSKKFTLIDFGCGEGDVLHHLHHLVLRSVGIELDKKPAERAYQRFKDTACVTILQQDMKNYSFENKPTIFYLYEPLWQVKDEQAVKDVYHNVFTNLRHVTQPVYLIYVTAVLDQQLSETMIDQYGFRILRMERLSRSLFFNNKVYLAYRETTR